MLSSILIFQMSTIWKADVQIVSDVDEYWACHQVLWAAVYNRAPKQTVPCGWFANSQCWPTNRQKFTLSCVSEGLWGSWRVEKLLGAVILVQRYWKLWVKPWSKGICCCLPWGSPLPFLLTKKGTWDFHPKWRGGCGKDSKNYYGIKLLFVLGKVLVCLLLMGARSHLLKFQRPEQSVLKSGSQYLTES